MDMTFLSSLTKNNLIPYAIALGVAFAVLLWLGMILWVFRDIRKRSKDPFLMIISVLLVLVVNIPGVIVYLIIRPGKTFEQKYQASLEEEALLREIGINERCPGCGHEIQSNWILCPYCHTKLKKKCVKCGQALELPWNICPFCGEQQQKPFES